MGIAYIELRMMLDVLSTVMNFCDYPLACGDYGVCSNGQCSCPSSNYFRLQSERHPDAGCIPLASISCDDMHDHKLIPLNNVSYFSYTAFQSLAIRVISEGVCLHSVGPWISQRVSRPLTGVADHILWLEVEEGRENRAHTQTAQAPALAGALQRRWQN